MRPTTNILHAIVSGLIELSQEYRELRLSHNYWNSIKTSRFAL